MRIVILTSGGVVASLTYNALVGQGFEISEIFKDIQFSKKLLIKKRIKKFGYFKVFGQLLFQTLVVKLLNIYYRKYLIELKDKFGVNSNWEKYTKSVVGINSDEAILAIKNSSPDLIVLAGTKVLSKRFLSNFQCPIVNVHVGITPKYRGVHGGYWALVNGDSQNLGVTVHFVDSGIDTGKVIRQVKVDVNSKDSFVTYGIKQLKAGVDLLAMVLNEYRSSNKFNTIETDKSQSKLYSHPTLFEYITNFVLKGVK